MTRTKLYLALQAVVCMLLTTLMCASAIDICLDGEMRKAEDPMGSIYTPEIVSERFAPIAPLFRCHRADGRGTDTGRKG